MTRRASFLCLGILLLCGVKVAPAQTVISPTNRVAFALSSDTIMESEGAYHVTVIRSSGLRGKFSVDVGVKTNAANTNVVVPSSWKGTNLVFNDYQLSAAFDLPIQDNTSSNKSAFSVQLEITNAVLAAGQDISLTPILGTVRVMTINVADDDVPGTVSFARVNNAAVEGGTIVIDVKPGVAPTDPQGLQVAYTVRAATLAEVSPGADLADVENDPATPYNENDLADGFQLTGTADYDSKLNLFHLRIPTRTDDLLEFDEEFIVELTGVNGDVADTASTNTPPDRKQLKVGTQALARGRILFNTNYAGGNGVSPQPMSAGSVDQLFNPDNVSPLRLRKPGANGPVTAVAVDLNDSYYVAGNFTAVDAVNRAGLARLLTNGVPDPTFVPAQNINGSVNTMDLYRSGPHAGQVVVGGDFTSVDGQSRNSVARYLSTGDLDPAFSIGLGANGPVYVVKTEGDNSTIIAGNFTTFDGFPRGNIARLKPDGTLDQNSFTGAGANGPVFDVVATSGSPFTITNAANNTTNIASFTNPVAARSGTLNLTYDNQGFTNIWTVTFGGATVVSRPLTNDFALVTNADNTITTNYIPGTLVLPLPLAASAPATLNISISPEFQTNSTSWSFSATVVPTGTIDVVAVGDFTTFNGAPVSRIVKVNANGVVNQVFASNIGTAADGPVQAVDLQSNGNIIIGGMFVNFNSQTVNNIARLLPDGTLDAGFASGTGANGGIRDIFVDRTANSTRRDRIYIAGDFTQYNNSRRIFVARLMPQGFLDTSFMDSAFNQYAGFPSSSGYAPDGTIASVAVGKNPGVLVGGSFELVGGGTNRADIRPRLNYARLVGGETPGPGNFSFASDFFGGDEGGGVLTAFFSLTNQATRVPVGFGAAALKTSDLSATAPADYAPQNFVGSIDPTAVDFYMEVPVVDDNLIEGDEEFRIDMPDISGLYVLGGEVIYPEMAFGQIRSATARIVDNDVPPAVFSFSQPEFNVDENRGTATIQIYRTGNPDGRATVQFSALPSGLTNTASTPADFTALTNQIIVFNSGDTNKAVTVTIRDDFTVEPDETIKLTLQNPSIGSILDTNRSSATLNIIDNDLPAGKIDFDFAGFTVNEGQLNAVVTATRSGGNVGLISVKYQTADGTATNGLDYLERSGRLTWNDRDITTRTILIPIVDDSEVEAPETFTLSLSEGSQPGVIGTRHPTTTVTINDNDFYGNLQFNGRQFFADENGGNAIIEVVRRGGNAGTVSVTVTTSPGTNVATAAIPDFDYVNVTNTLTFAPGETAKTFVVPILNDTAVDGPRDVRVTLSAPVNASLGANTNALLTILDDETVNIPAGGVDTDFVSADGANGPVNVVRVYNEATNALRKILIAGEFTQYSHLNRERLARLNNDGSLDRNFAANTHVDAAIRAALVLPDGKILIGGHFTQIDDANINHVARLNSIGHYDSSFQPGAGADNAVYALAQTFAGDPTNNLARFLVGGDFVTFNTISRQRIAMLLTDGSVDPNFDPGLGANSSVYAIAVQRDQKILIGGAFTSVAGVSRPFIARLNPDGSLDNSFDPGIGFDGPVRSIVIQDDDRILAGGDFLTFGGQSRAHVARLDVSGLLDLSFDPGTGADGPVNSLALQADGKIVVVGDFSSFNGSARRSLVRILPSGLVDLDMNLGAGPNGVVQSVAVQNDRGIVFGGDFTEVDGYPRLRVARIYGGAVAGSGALQFDQPSYSVGEATNAVSVTIRRIGGLEGTVTATYQTTAITATPGADYTETTNLVTFLPGEQFHTVTIPILDDLLPEDVEYFQVSLSNPVGGTIGRQPVTTVAIISDDTRVGFATDTFVVNENAPGGRAIITLTLDGAIDQPVIVAFTTSDGTATAGQDYSRVASQITFFPGDTVKTVNVPIIDDILVEGDETVNLSVALVSPAPNITLGVPTATLTIVDNDNAPGVLQFSGDVNVDESSGFATVTVTRSAGKLGAVTVDYTTLDGTAHAPADYVSRSGTLSFQQTDVSKTITIPINEDTEVEGNETFTVRLSNATGGAAVGLKSSSIVTIVDNDFGPGSLDTSFDIGSGANGTNAIVYAALIQPDGKIVVGGNFTDFSNSGHPRLARLLPTGSIDPNFASGTGPDATVYALGLADAGRIDVGGAFHSFNSLDRRFFTRVTSSGAPDLSFTADAGLNDLVRAMDPQPNFNVVIGGAFTSPTLRAGRVLVSGSFDVSLNVGAGANTNVLDTKVQQDGKVLFSGQFTQFGGLPRGHVVRVFTNGLVDQAFDTSIGANADVNRVLPLSGNRVLVAGNFTRFNSSSAGRIAVLNDDGSVDTAFVANGGTGANGAIWAVALQKDGRIIIGGDFSSFNGQGRGRIARLNANGSLDDTFKPGLGPDNTVYDIDIQPDQKILISGAFKQVNGFPRAGVARLNSPAAEITISNIGLSASDLTLTFRSEEGVTYVLEATDDLNNPNWAVVKDNITGTGSSTTTTIAFDATNPHRFFRIRQANP